MPIKLMIDNADYDDWNEYGRWLNEQASKGLYFKFHLVGVTIFTKCQEKSKWKYSCIPANDHADTLGALATLKETGWERVSRRRIRVYRINAKKPATYIPTVAYKPPTVKSLVISQIVLAVFCLTLWGLLYAATLYSPDNKTPAIVGGLLLTAMMAFVAAADVYNYRKRKQKKRGNRYVIFFLTVARLALSIAFYVVPFLLKMLYYYS